MKSLSSSTLWPSERTFGVEAHYIDEQQFANANTLQDCLGHKGRGRGVLHHPLAAMVASAAAASDSKER
jgi:hypothetical protein